MSQKQPHSLILLTGCNIEPKQELLIRAAELLHQRVGRVVAHSDIYLTEAWGFSADELFANMALELQTTLEPLEVLDLTQATFARKKSNSASWKSKPRSKPQRLPRARGTAHARWISTLCFTMTR